MIADSQCQGYCRQEEQVNMIVIASLDGRTRSKPELYKDQGQGESHDIKIHRGRGLGIAQGLKNIVVTSDLVITCCDQLHDALVKVRQSDDSHKTLDQVKVTWNMIGGEGSREVTRTFM